MKSVFRFLSTPFMLLLFTLAFTGCGGGGDSNSSGKPSAPTNVKATPGNGTAIVSWDAVSGAKSYNVYYSTTKGATDGVKATSGKIENATSPCTVTGLTNGTVYYFEVTAVNSSGESGLSEETSTTPAPIPPIPTGISATGGNGEVTVGWTAVSGATSYNVYYGTTAGVTKLNGTKVANAVNPNSITGLTNGTTYFFVVTAVNSAGESDVSAEKSATPSASLQPPASPTGIVASDGDTQAIISWNSVPGATSYIIYYSTKPGVTKTSGTKISSATSPKTITGLVNGTTYYIVVTAVGPGGESAESAERAVTPTASQQPPPRPRGTSAYPGNQNVTMTWSLESGVTAYNIYYATTPGVTTTNGIKIANVTTPYIVSPLTNGTTYYFVVTAVGPGGESSVSSESSAIPSATPAPPPSPNGVGGVSGPGTGQISVTWNLQVTSTFYNIYYVSGWTSNSNPSPATIMATGTKLTVAAVPYSAGGTQSHVIAGLTPGQEYSFVVTAVNTVGESGAQNNNKHAPAGL